MYKNNRVVSFLLAVLLLLSACTGGNAGASEKQGPGTGVVSVERVDAASMRLVRVEGTVSLADEAGGDVSVVENMRLFSGNTLTTRTESRAGIALDKTKTATLGAESEAVISQMAKRLHMDLTHGEMYFNISTPLQPDESFDIETSTMILGVRGTTGYVANADENETTVILTSGKAAIRSANGAGYSITAGKKVVIERDEDGLRFIETSLTAWELPALMLEELERDPAALERTLEESGFSREDLQAAIDGTARPEDLPAEEAESRVVEYDPNGNLTSQTVYRTYSTESGDPVFQTFQYDQLNRTVYVRADYGGALDGAYDQMLYTYTGSEAAMEHESWGFDARYHTGEHFEYEYLTYTMESPDNHISVLSTHFDYPDREKMDANVTVTIGEFTPESGSTPIRQKEYWFEMAYRWTSY